MALTVTPRVVLGGDPVQCSPEHADTEPIVVRDIAVEWGRSEYLGTSAEPSSAEITLLDTSGRWARLIRSNDAVGTTVEITWQANRDTVTLFRGRVSTARARPTRRTTSDGRAGWIIALQCADRTADMGNAIAFPAVWPRETMLKRAVRVRDLGQAGNSGIQQVYFFPLFVDTYCAPLDVKDKSALDLMGDMYESIGGDTWAYDHDANVVRHSIRLSQSYTTRLETYDSSRGAVLIAATDIVVDGVTYPGIGLAGCDLPSDRELTASPETDINRVEVSWKDHSTNFGEWRTHIEAVQPGDARRVLSYDSWIDDGISIDPTLENVWSKVREEGARPRHPVVTIRPGKSFITERMARWCLQCWDNTRPAFISGDGAYQWLMSDGNRDYAPVVCPLGGTTRYSPDHGWEIDLRVHWLHNQNPPRASVPWERLQQIRTRTESPSVPWWWTLLGRPLPPPVRVGEHTPERDLKWGHPDAVEGYAFDPSVSWSDLKHLAESGAQITDQLE